MTFALGAVAFALRGFASSGSPKLAGSSRLTSQAMLCRLLGVTGAESDGGGGTVGGPGGGGNEDSSSESSENRSSSSLSWRDVRVPAPFDVADVPVPRCVPR
uniref:Putative secreted protein n=1 Tax=Anopheles darlingi TaxID=43151 RepID=A0A2M4DMB6_ANODA